MSEMIERVAKAQAEERDRWINRLVPGGNEVCREDDGGGYVVVEIGGDYDDLTERAVARAAIEAMEPFIEEWIAQIRDADRRDCAER